MIRYCGDYEYRYVAVRGLERRNPSYTRVWERVTPEMLACMTPKELRHVADVMEGDGDAPEFRRMPDGWGQEMIRRGDGGGSRRD